MSRRPRGAAALAAAVLLAAPASAGDGPAARRLLVLAAASLAEALRAAAAEFERAHPGTRVELAFAGSSALAHQVEEGAVAGVLATADDASMKRAAVAGALGTPPRVFARNGLAIAVAPGNPRGVRGLADLAQPGTTVALCAPAVPCGRYAREAFERAGAAVPPASEELDVKAALAKVALGEADAAVVYRTDVLAAGDRVTGVLLPPAHDVLARYPVATLREAPEPALARAFVAFLVAPEGRAVLARFGFLSP